MARHFVSLKLRLLANASRSGKGALGLILSIVFGLPIAGYGFVLFSVVARQAPAWDLHIAVIGFTLVFLGWSLLPVIGFGSDETLDPARLALLPLSRRQMVTGLAAAACVGVPPIATFLALAGTLVGYFTPRGVVLVLAAVVVEVVLCVTASRAVVTALSRRLRSRRGRDALIVVVALLGVGIQVVNLMAGRLARVGPGAGQWLDRLTLALSWTPPGLAGRAVAEAGRGQLGTALAALAGACLWVAFFARCWWRSLDVVLTTAEGAGSAAARKKPEGLFPRAYAGVLPASRSGAVAARQLRSYWRDPRLRVGWLNAGMVAALFPAVGILRSSRPPIAVLFAAAGVTGAAELIAANQLGSDGRALWSHAVAPDNPRADLLGKNYALFLVALPLAAAVAIVLAAVTGGWVYVPAAILLAAAGIGASVGVGNVTSVMAPFALTESSSNAWGAPAGSGCAMGFVGLAGMASVGLLLSPVVAGVVLTRHHWSLGVIVVVALLYGAVLWRIGLEVAAGRLRGHYPELLERLSPRV